MVGLFDYIGLGIDVPTTPPTTFGQPTNLDNPRVNGQWGDPRRSRRGGTRPHRGMDVIAQARSDTTRGMATAANHGVVSIVGDHGDSGYGKFVEVKHPDGHRTRYAHLDDIDVTEGQAVTMGDPVGSLGSTGGSTGPHLHFEVLDAYGRKIDPESVGYAVSQEIPGESAASWMRRLRS